MTFVSLTHQIDSGIKRGCKETEIVAIDAVIRAISLHSSLRSYVETRKDLSLPKLRKILRVHYREKSAPELYQNLATIFQEPKETPQQFLLRSLDLRNKVGFASKESDCEVQYDEPLIQKTFMKSFETGLRDDILAANLRPILRLSELSDEDLMRHVNELASHQAERQSKLACERRSAKINACEVDGAEIKERKHGGENKILAEIREIKSDLANLKKQANDRMTVNREVSPGGRKSSKTSRRRGWGCNRPQLPALLRMRRIWSYCDRVLKEFETFGKRGPATPPSGQGLAGELPSRQCNHCLKCLIGNFWRCKCCKLVNYCNRQCQRSDWPHHKPLCTAISNREFKHSEAPQDNRQEVFMSHLTPKEHEKLIKLVGRRCTVKGKLNGKTVEILWDTGAQVSIISNKYLEEHFSDCKIKDVSELLNCDLALTAANGSTIPYEE